jgi:hypothetical protein
MTTARIVLTGALRLLRVIADEETPTASQLVDGLEALNQRLHSLKSHNADLAYQDITLDDDLPLPPEHTRPIKYLMAAELAPEYGTQMTPEVAVEAKEALPTLQAYFRRARKLRVDEGIHDRISRYDYNINTDD